MNVAPGPQPLSPRSIQVVSGLEIEDGGPSYSVPRLSDSLRRAGIDDHVFADLTPGDAANDAADTIHAFKRDYGRLPGLRKLHISYAMSRRLQDPEERIDLIHSHGLWRMPNIYAAHAARGRGVPHIVSPRGMLSRVALNFSKASKQVFWRIGQGQAIASAGCLHATSEAEYLEFRAAGIKRPVAVIPNGIDLPDAPSLFGPAVRGSPEHRTLLYVGRVHPKKGLDDLVRAWAVVAPRHLNWRLRIVGSGEPHHLQALERLRSSLHVQRISLEPAIYGDEKWTAFSSADLFVLPTHNENFGLTVAESLACRRPVIVTKGAPWAGVETHRCGWWIEAGHAALVEALHKALAMPDAELNAMGLRGESWVREEYAWDAIGVEMANVYRWLLGTGARPDCVITSL